MPTVKYAISDYVADGTTTDYLITWDYLDEDHIAVYVDGTSNADPTANHTFTKLNSTTLRITDGINGAIAAGVKIEIRRETPLLTRAITFADGSALLAEDLNKNSDYLLYSMQEALDTVEGAALDGALAAEIATEALRDEAEDHKDDAEAAQIAAETARDTTQGYLATVQSDATDADNHRIASEASETAAAASQVASAASQAASAASQAASAVSETSATLSQGAAASSASSASTSESNAAASAVAAADAVVGISLGNHTLGHDSENIIIENGSKFRIDSTFDHTTKISNLGKPNQQTLQYHSVDTGPWTQTFSTEGLLGEDKHINPKWQLGTVPFGGIGEPMIALFYSDEGDDRDGMLSRGEITQAEYDGKPANTFDPANRFYNEDKITWITEPGGTFAVVRDRPGSCFEGFTWDDHTSGASGGPSFRVASSAGGGYRGGYIEFGRGKSSDCDFRISRDTGAYIPFRVNNNDDKLILHNHLAWRRGLTFNDGMALYFANDGQEVIESFTATADFDQSYTVSQTLGSGYVVKDVTIQEEGVSSDALATNGQAITITSHKWDDTASGLVGSANGRSVRAGDTVRIRMVNPSLQNTTLKLKADYDVANSRTILNLGGVLKATDVVNAAGESAFANSNTFRDAGSVASLDAIVDSAVFRASSTTDLPPNASRYGAGLSVKPSSGNAGFQLYTDYYDGDLHWRTGLPSSTGWNSKWYRAASREWVTSQIGSNWTVDATTTITAAAGDKLLVDTSSSSVAITLPSSPTVGDVVSIVDAEGNAATNNITISSTKPILGANQPLVVDRDSAGLTLVYYNNTRGYVLTEN